MYNIAINSAIYKYAQSILKNRDLALFLSSRDLVLIQSPKRESLVSNIIIISGRNKAAACVCRALYRDSVCAQKRAKYVLGEPKLDVKDMYVIEILSHLLADAEARSLVSDSFPKCI